jgi:hypothetical protein
VRDTDAQHSLSCMLSLGTQGMIFCAQVCLLMYGLCCVHLCVHPCIAGLTVCCVYSAACGPAPYFCLDALSCCAVMEYLLKGHCVMLCRTPCCR